MVRNKYLRMSPAEARASLNADCPPKKPHSLYDDASEAGEKRRARDLEECPDFDDMSGE